jgi:hypothetical protein
VIEHYYDTEREVTDRFRLYAAISRVLPEAHGAGWAIAPAGRGFVIRGPAAAPRIPVLQYGSERVQAKPRGSAAIAHSEFLVASIVIVRLTDGPGDRDSFRARVLAHVKTRAAALGADEVQLGHEWGVRVHGRLIRGFGCWVRAGVPDASIAVQTVGIGGKRSMGAGVFFGCDRHETPWR